MEHDIGRSDQRGPGAHDIVTLSDEECLRLLETQDMGRLALVVGGKPAVFSVNYAMAGRHIVIRTGPGAKLDGAPLGWAAFEVDQFEPASLTGWDVVASGMARDITHALDDTSAHLRSLDIVPWVTGDKSHHLAIFGATFTGRRLARRPPATSGL